LLPVFGVARAGFVAGAPRRASTVSHYLSYLAAAGVLEQGA
jgi:hypothetical protein